VERRALTMTVAEAAGLLGISRPAAYECVRRGELRAIRLGHRLVIPRSVVNELIDGTTRSASDVGPSTRSWR